MSRPHYDIATYSARESVGFLVRRLYMALHGRLEQAFTGEALTFTQWIVLIHLRDGIANTAADIARGLQHDSGALTRVIDQLESRGLVVRRRSRQDRRVVELGLTAAGRRMAADLLPIVVGLINDALAPLSAREFQKFREYLLRVLSHVDPAARTPGPARVVTPPPPKKGARRAAASRTRGSAKKRVRT